MAMKPLDKVLINPLNAAEMLEDCKTLEHNIEQSLRGDPNARRLNIQENAERLARIKKQLNEEVAHEGDLTGSERDQLAREEKALREKITYGMLDEATMRRCPSDAPNRHIAWENANIKDIQRWKNIRQQLDPLNPEAQNLETFRPRGPVEGYGYREEGAIAGKMAYTGVPQQNWDQAFPSQPQKTVTMPVDTQKTRGTAGWTPAKREAARQRGLASATAAHDKKATPPLMDSKGDK